MLRDSWISAVSALALMGLCGMLGCREIQGPDESRVKELARSWPAYRPPSTVDTIVTTAGRDGPSASSVSPQSNPLPPSPPVRPVQDWNLEETAIDSLGRIGTPAVPALIQSLGHADPGHRLQAAEVLGRIGPDARQAVPALVQALEDPQLDVRKAAARALGQIGPAAQEAVAPLMEIVDPAFNPPVPIAPIP